MGGFYASIQFRKDDRDAIARLAERIAKERGDRFLCGPALDGWVGLYPNQNGQDERVAAALARGWPGELFCLIVHDGDLLVYRHFRAGEPRRFESNYAKQRAWRDERGFTLAEVARLVAARRRAKAGGFTA